MLDLRSLIQSILALYGLNATRRSRGPAPICIGRPDVRRLGGRFET